MYTQWLLFISGCVFGKLISGGNKTGKMFTGAGVNEREQYLN